MKKYILSVCALFLTLSITSATSPTNVPTYILYGFPISETESPEKITIFAHGLKGSASEAKHYIAHGLIKGACVSVNIYDHQAPQSNITLGQNNEIFHLKTIIDLVHSKYPTSKIILRGVSMGAVTALNYLGSHKNTCVNRLELESPFASTTSVLKNIVKNNIFYRILNYPLGWVKYKLLKKYYPKHDINGIQPIDAIKKIQIPIHITASKEDLLIPYQDAEELGMAAKNSGNPNCTVLIVDKGAHAQVCFSDCKKIIEQSLENFRNQNPL